MTCVVCIKAVFAKPAYRLYGLTKARMLQAITQSDFVSGHVNFVDFFCFYSTIFLRGCDSNGHKNPHFIFQCNQNYTRHTEQEKINQTYFGQISN